MLKACYSKGSIEAGCDEAGRGCLAGPVVAAAVILPPRFRHKWLNDSKQLHARARYELREEITEKALAWAVGFASETEIDEINILNASFLAMHRALESLGQQPGLILVDGNRFKPYRQTPHHCIIKGDGIYLSIAAASILAKTFRDDHMDHLHQEYPQYNWLSNKGYPTPAHRLAIAQHGATRYHRQSFTLLPPQLRLPL